MLFKLGFYYHSRKTGKCFTYMGTDRRGMLHFVHNSASNAVAVRLFPEEADDVFRAATGYRDREFENIKMCFNPDDVPNV
jgi:hypothetical protein